jgi:hypothetical protein
MRVLSRGRSAISGEVLSAAASAVYKARQGKARQGKAVVLRRVGR